LKNLKSFCAGLENETKEKILQITGFRLGELPTHKSSKAECQAFVEKDYS